MVRLRIDRTLTTAAAGTGRLAGPAGSGHRARAPHRHRGCRAVCAFAGFALLAAVGVSAVPASVALASSSSVLNWTEQAPATSPSARNSAAMAYDAATGNVVLFGGEGKSGNVLDGTWAWDGTTWTRPAPATSPPAVWGAAMAYDAATGNVVLFGGADKSGIDLGGTWTWNGATWTRQTPKSSPPPRDDAAMAYDAATGNVVLFGGFSGRRTSRLG